VDKERISEGHYFDWAATAPPDPAATEAARRLAEAGVFGNPSSAHRAGRLAKEALERARADIAGVLEVPPGTLFFTSGGTEANCIALYAMLGRQGSGRIMASLGEHPSVRENLGNLGRLGKKVGDLPLDPSGRVSPEPLARALVRHPDARFAAMMAVNGETGAIGDLAALRDVLRRSAGPPIHFHCDMVQALGKIPVDLAGLDLDSASFSGHKLGGPRGIGLLYLKKPCPVLYMGGGQEGGIRPGTENVAGAVALAECIRRRAAAPVLERNLEAADLRCRELLSGLVAMPRCTPIPADRKPGDPRFSPYVLQVGFKGIPGEVMVRALDERGFAVSTGSACSSATPDRPVLKAMGIGPELAREGIRISQGPETGPEEIALLLGAIREVLKFL